MTKTLPLLALLVGCAPDAVSIDIVFHLPEKGFEERAERAEVKAEWARKVWEPFGVEIDKVRFVENLDLPETYTAGEDSQPPGHRTGYVNVYLAGNVISEKGDNADAIGALGKRCESTYIVEEKNSKKATIGHEIGHLLGLTDNDTKGNLMNSDKPGTELSDGQVEDLFKFWYTRKCVERLD